jgi:hypothetical protein
MNRNMSRLAAVSAALLVLAACESPEERRDREARVSRERIAAESARASVVAAVPRSATWSDAQLVKRLVDAGLAPQRRDGVRGEQWMGVPVLAYQLGAAKLDAYIYHDSTARLAIMARLDPLTLAPADRESPRGVPRALIQNGNLLAIVVGGTDRQRDRIASALAAGVSAP